MESSFNNTSQSAPPSPLSGFQGWKLEDAKAHFSELVRLARDKEPQRVTVRGKDAVIVLSAEKFEQLLPWIQQPNLHALLSQSPFAHLELNEEHPRLPIRDSEF